METMCDRSTGSHQPVVILDHWGQQLSCKCSPLSPGQTVVRCIWLSSKEGPKGGKTITWGSQLVPTSLMPTSVPQPYPWGHVPGGSSFVSASASGGPVFTLPFTLAVFQQVQREDNSVAPPVTITRLTLQGADLVSAPSLPPLPPLPTGLFPLSPHNVVPTLQSFPPFL